MTAFQTANQPVISVDTKKKELVGNYKNGGREWQPRGEPERVDVHDFKGELGRAVPYGVYDMTANIGWVNVGTDADTGQFAVESIRRWWKHVGELAYPNATKLLITADSGGSNGNRLRLWKVELAKLADELNLEISVSHLPPGTSKWNKIEHRLFSQISMNWRGRPLTSHQVIVETIAATTTRTGPCGGYLEDWQYHETLSGRPRGEVGHIPAGRPTRRDRSAPRRGPPIIHQRPRHPQPAPHTHSPADRAMRLTGSGYDGRTGLRRDGLCIPTVNAQLLLHDQGLLSAVHVSRFLGHEITVRQ